MVVVDQFGEALLTHYGPVLQGGIGRLLDEGACFEQTTVPYAIGNSGPGHASLATRPAT